MIKSLRIQLTAWYLLFFTVVFLLVGAFLYGLLSRALYQRLDERLDFEVNTGISIFQSELAEAQGNVSVAATETLSELHGWDLRVAFFEGGRRLGSNAPMEEGALSQMAARAGGNGQEQVLATIPVRAGRLRSLARRFSANGQSFVVLAAGGLEQISENLRLVRQVLLITLPLVVLIVGAGGYLLATRNLAPVRRMAEQAKLITDRDLQKGLETNGAVEELQLLADSFNELLKRLERSFATIRCFVADASHELRTPLAIIRGEADVSLASDRAPAEYKESITIIQDEARRLSRLVDDLLNLARADGETVRMRLESFYLNDLLAECCRSAQPLAASKHIDLICRTAEDVMFEGDQELLRRLTLNLLDNAIRYTPEGGKVSVRLEAGQELRISVEDTGMGISPEAAGQVFERFYRADQARSRERGGFGLGLSIVKWIAESHRGKVQLVSQPGVGSTFTVLLPR